jgi:hypothetical protein
MFLGQLKNNLCKKGCEPDIQLIEYITQSIETPANFSPYLRPLETPRD